MTTCHLAPSLQRDTPIKLDLWVSRGERTMSFASVQSVMPGSLVMRRSAAAGQSHRSCALRTPSRAVKSVRAKLQVRSETKVGEIAKTGATETLEDGSFKVSERF